MQIELSDTPTTITPRQRQVVELIAAGYSNNEIAAELGISPRTAKAHCDNLRERLGVLRRRQIPAAYFRLTGSDPFTLLTVLATASGS